MSDLRFCPNCGEQFGATARFCGGCGQALAASTFFPAEAGSQTPGGAPIDASPRGNRAASTSDQRQPPPQSPQQGLADTSAGPRARASSSPLPGSSLRLSRPRLVVVTVVIVAILVVVWAVANHSGGPLLTKTATVNLTYTEGIAVAPNGKRVYTVRLHDSREGAVDVIDTASNHVVGSIDVEEGPTDIAVSPDGSQAFVSYIQVSPNGHLTVIDLASNTVTGTIQVNGNVSSVIFSRDGTKAYASLSDGIAVIDVKSQTVTSRIDLPDVGRVAVSPDGRRGYAPSYSANQVNVLDLATNQIVDRIAVGSEPGGAAMTPDGRQVYVANAKSGDVSMIDPASDRVVATLPVTTQANDRAWGVQVAPDGRYAYVRLDSEIVAIDTSTNTVAGRVTEGVFPTGMAITVDGTKAYVSHHSDSMVTVLESG